MRWQGLQRERYIRTESRCAPAHVPHEFFAMSIASHDMGRSAQEDAGQPARESMLKWPVGLREHRIRPSEYRDRYQRKAADGKSAEPVDVAEAVSAAYFTHECRVQKRSQPGVAPRGSTNPNPMHDRQSEN